MTQERHNYPGRYFPLEEYEDRWQRVRDEMARRGVEIAVVWGQTAGNYERAMEITWLSNHYSEYSGADPDSRAWNARSYGCVILERGKEPELHADGSAFRPDLVATSNNHSHMDVVAGVAESLNARTPNRDIAFVGSDCLPVKYADQLRAAVPAARFVFDDDLVRACRRIKSAREIECYREGGRIVSDALQILCTGLLAGNPAAETVAKAGAEIVRRGGNWHRIPVNFGDTSAFVQRDPTYGFSQDTPRDGDMARFSVDGPIHQGYWFDPCRTLVVGAKPSADQRALMEESYSVVQLILDTIKPGAKVLDIAKQAEARQQAVTRGEDHAAAMWPMNGHGNGMMWEPPFISTLACDEDESWEENMVGGAECFMGWDGVGAVGWEQNFIVTATGTELITTTPVIWY